MPDIITDGYDGFVITKFDTDQYADALVKLVNDSSLTNLMSHRARQSILKRNDVDLIACQYRNLYESILKAS
jgi:glycosyltransferase involved in cell wall biosynthesis